MTDSPPNDPLPALRGIGITHRFGATTVLHDADITGRPSSLYYAQVQALKFLQTRATPAGARRATRRRQVKKAVAGREGS